MAPIKLRAVLRGLEIACHHLVQDVAQIRGAFAAESLLEAGLGLCPSGCGDAQTGNAGLGQPDLLCPSILAAGRDLDQAFTLERLDVSSERRPIHHQLFGKAVDGQRTTCLQLCQDRKLG